MAYSENKTPLGLEEKATMVDADGFVIGDSEDESNEPAKFLSWLNLKTLLTTFFDTLYTRTASLGAVATSNDYNDLSNKPDLSIYDDLDSYADLASFPGTGASDKLYLAEDTGIVYRWNGSAYVQVSTSGTSDHGALAGLADDDHPQYSIIVSGAADPATAPPRAGAVYHQTTSGAIFIATGTDSAADWSISFIGGTLPKGTILASTGAGSVAFAPGSNGQIIEYDNTTTTGLKAVTPSGSGGGVTNGAGAPSSTPSTIGERYYDTTNKRVYHAFGISSSADWRGSETFANS